LFDRYYTQQCTAEERQEFLELLEKTTYDIELKQKLDDLLLEAEVRGGMPEEAATEVLQVIMQTGSKDAPARVRKFNWLRMAAAVVLLVGAAGLLQLFIHPRHISPERQAIAITPGRDRATLLRDDGSEVDLELSGNGEVNVQQGLHAKKTGDELRYDSREDIVPSFNTILTPRGGQYRIVLPDGSRVWLNAASSVRFPTAFTGKRREVEVTGEVYFEIAANATQPFIVKARDMEVAVLGTHFNIMAYEDEEDVRTTLLEGAVNVSRHNVSKVLRPGQQAVLELSNNQMGIVTADIDQVMAWKEGRFEFSGNISGIMRQVARWYDVEVEYKGDFTGKDFGGAISRDADIRKVLKMLEMTGSIHFEITDKKVTVIP
jgi:ferric-dicitrate binding protein FerR (iron transport regulator)